MFDEILTCDKYDENIIIQKEDDYKKHTIYNCKNYKLRMI